MVSAATWLDHLYTAAQAVVLVVGLLAIVSAPVRHFLARPKIEIRAKAWQGRGGEAWHFAAVDVRNAPLPRFLSAFLTRQPALDCHAQIEFRRQGQLVMQPVDARWSARPEALREIPVLGQGEPQIARIAAHDLVQASKTYDLPAAPRWEEIAVAVLLKDGQAYAWGAESYLYNWQNPDWRLERGEYEVTIRVGWGDREARRTFDLRFLSGSFAEFRLTERGT